MTEVEIERVKKIQNGQKSLGWGSHQTEDGVLFVVGHKAYKGKILYFIVDNDYNLYLLKDDNTRELNNEAIHVEDLISHCIIPLLKQWFPPIGMSSTCDINADVHQGGLASAT